jgi:hypothetical protein
MATILINVSKKKFNKCFVVNESAEYHIVNESARKTLCNLFDALGNISSYNDYNSFLESYRGFSKFAKCTSSKLLKLKDPLEFGQGILVTIDKHTQILTLPTDKQLDWFLEKYQYSTITLSVNGHKEESVVEDEDEVDEDEESVVEKEVEEEAEEEAEQVEKEVESEEEKEEEEAEEEEPKKETPTGITSTIWNFFGWK